MKRSEKTFTCLIILSMLTLTSCLQKTTSTRNDRNSGSNDQTTTTPPYYNNETPPPTGSGSDPDAPGVPDYGQETPYRTLSNIIVKGRANPAPITTLPFWSSQSTFSPPDDHIFSTDSRFNLRVVARSAPGQGATATDGSQCPYQTASPYTKLQIDVCVRAASGSCNVSNTHTFTNVGVGFASSKKAFSVPATSNPLVVEVKDVQSDLSCAYYKSMGYTEAQVPGYCPYAPHWYTECARFDIQFATDNTMDLPN